MQPDTQRFHRSQLRLLPALLAPWLFILKEHRSGWPVWALAAIAVLALIDFLWAPKVPLIEVDLAGFKLRNSLFAKTYSIGVAEVTRWAMPRSFLVLGRIHGPDVRVLSGSLKRTDRERLAILLEQRLGPPHQELARKARSKQRRTLWIAASIGLAFTALFAVILFKTAPPTKVEYPPFLDSPYTGLWQFPERWVWIAVSGDGHTFQCRIGRSGYVYSSEGTLFRDYRIEWQHPVWGTDTITAADDKTLVLTGPGGTSTYRRIRMMYRSEVNSEATYDVDALRKMCAERAASPDSVSR